MSNGFRPALSSSWGYLLVCASIVLGVTITSARAGVILDTFAPGDTATGLNLSLTRSGENSVGVAVAFSTDTTTTIDAILVAISGTGGLTLGVANSVAGLPATAFLHNSVLTDPIANVSLTGLGWTLSAGDYWLVAASSVGFIGSWQQGTFGPGPAWATDAPFGVGDWTLAQPFGAPAARLTTAGTEVPEPHSIGLLCVLAVIASLRRRA